MSKDTTNLPSKSPASNTIMARTKSTKEKSEETQESSPVIVDQKLAAILEAYKLQNPAKYEAKKAELERKLQGNA